MAYIGRLRVEVKRTTPRPGVEVPVYMVILQNHEGPTGRPINHREVLGWEDLLALHKSLCTIVARDKDHVVNVAQEPGTTVFKEAT